MSPLFWFCPPCSAFFSLLSSPPCSCVFTFRSCSPLLMYSIIFLSLFLFSIGCAGRWRDDVFHLVMNGPSRHFFILGRASSGEKLSLALAVCLTPLPLSFISLIHFSPSSCRPLLEELKSSSTSTRYILAIWRQNRDLPTRMGSIYKAPSSSPQPTLSWSLLELVLKS